ncbi:helix-turn-helix domain-containing protein [Paenibacillus silvisoli]|uniref:helix-turn-helix domain-containing protein n=1 Tax=Paenibacillus silvisoli TaxID=3110539 RepID=UPI0028038850|nr:AraC family transcriptional regulator [Paenibacillus silvisoli]
MGKPALLQRASSSLHLQPLLFLAILVPLIALSIFSYTLLKNHAADEVIRNETLSFAKTVEDYENLFLHIRTIGLELLQGKKPETLNQAIPVQNILVYHKISGFVVSGGRSDLAAELFTKYYQSDDYSPEFWEMQFYGSDPFSVLPASVFNELSGNRLAVKGRYMPVVIRSSETPDDQVIVMLEMNRMLREFHDSGADPFLMIDASGLRLTGVNVGDKMQTLPFEFGARTLVTQDGLHYFSRVGDVTGIRYITTASERQIAEQMSRINAMLLTLLVLFSAISVYLAWCAAKRFHPPVKRKIPSIRRQNDPQTVQTQPDRQNGPIPPHEQELPVNLTVSSDRVKLQANDKKAHKDGIIDFVKSYMEQHYREDVTLDMLSDKLGITASYLSTYFKAKTGMNFIDYINNYRIELAKSLLCAADMRIQDVASQVGYHNINSFNRMFKKISGVTPSEFRKLHYP